MSLPKCDTCGHDEVDHAEAGGPCLELSCACSIYAIDIQKHVLAERERCISVVLNGAGVAPWGWRVEVANEIKKLT